MQQLRGMMEGTPRMTGCVSVLPDQRALPFFASVPATIVIFGLLIRPAVFFHTFITYRWFRAYEIMPICKERIPRVGRNPLLAIPAEKDTRSAANGHDATMCVRYTEEMMKPGMVFFKAVDNSLRGVKRLPQGG
jgi:hypothetical protein